jgi:L-alanine-DL-glutamate epimerase-like enolase superfamily enzyme
MPSAEALRLNLDVPRRMAAGTLVVRGSHRARQAVAIRLHDGRGSVGLGEAVPLPGYSRDDADTVQQVLAVLAAKVADGGLCVPPAANAVAQVDATLAPHAALLDVTPGARFALECALVDLLSRRAGVSAASWLADGRSLQPVPVSVLLPDDVRDAAAAATAAVARGHSVLKLKIALARRTAEEEDALLAAVRAAADAARPDGGRRARLRLDANGALDTQRAPARLATLAQYGIELVEEPVAGTALLALPALALPWAADESLADPALVAALLALPPQRRPAALALKPAQLGMVRCLALAQVAAKLGLGVIVTHSMDGDLGYAAACALAAALPRPPWPCGLAPHPGLRAAALSQPYLPAPTAHGLGVADRADLS